MILLLPALRVSIENLFRKELRKMSRMCDICGKKTNFGNNVSHSHKKTKRTFKPNIQKARVEIKGKVKNISICTSCLKANKVEKVV